MYKMLLDLLVWYERKFEIIEGDVNKIEKNSTIT